MNHVLALTEQQQAVVDHDDGPALVFAVAGAGKTTAMVHRIERLVRARIFTPAQILATSFGRANIRDLRRALQPWPHCRPVDIRTLHSLGREVIRRAQQFGYLGHLRLDRIEGGESSLEQRLLDRTLGEARRRNVPYKRELEGLDRQDFLAYVGYCKGNLLYAHLEEANLPAAAREKADQASAPSSMLAYYLNLYELLEQVRLRLGWVTFDDMLLTGWETLVRYPDVLVEVQQLYRCVLVDEFQDVNLAQAEILDLITQPHRHYMAIGDDDQTIYEWRGADSQFILDFSRRYQAQTYVISDNFRCPAAPLALANAVICHNRKRYEKRLSLTRGFGGETAVHFDAEVATMSAHIVERIRSLHAAGIALNDMAVLVRLNAQTPYIEQRLIAQGIPYRVSQPFYDRLEIKTLIHYVRLAWIEQSQRRGSRPLANAAARDKFAESWRSVCNRPTRYIGYELREQIERAVLVGGRPLSQAALAATYSSISDWLVERLEQLAADLDWLADNLDQPAHLALRELEARLDYMSFLRRSSGFPQTGEGRAASIAAFIDYARDRGSLLTFMQHIRQLADQKIGQERAAREDAVTLSTIHQAKGLEWPVVFVAQCNQGIMPFDAERTADLEEERRLFYVAITRTRRHLHLHCVQNEPVSQFLREAQWRQTLAGVASLWAVLERDPQKWQAADALTVFRQSVHCHLERYFQRWWDEDPQQQEQVAHTMQRFFSAAQQRDLLAPLGLDVSYVEGWRKIAPLPAGQPANDFPGLAELVPPARRLLAD